MRREARLGLQTQILLAVGVVAVAAVAAVTVASRYGTRQEFRRFQDIERRAVAGRVDALTESLAAQLGGSCCSPAQLDAARASLGADLGLFVIDVDDNRLVAWAGAPLATLRDLVVRRRGAELAVDAVRVLPGGSVERLALTFLREGTSMRLADGRSAALYVLPFPSDARDREAAVFLGSVDRRLIGAAIFAGLLAVLATWLIAGRTVKPINDLRAATRDLAAGHLERRVDPAGGREVADLARAFNTMADDLERQQVLRRHLVTDVAHELRAPLTALQCRLETVQDGLAADPALAIAQARDEVLHLGRLVDDLQELALAEARELRLDARDVPLAAIVASAATGAGLEAGGRLTVDVPDGITARCDPVRARQMVLNLLTNAERYTPPDGTISIRVESRGAEAAVIATNTGSRLEPEEIARVFDRFYRTDPSRQRVTGGTGLGLAIVKHLAEAQGGRAWAESDGRSVTVGFTLPR
jgi:signal transduction histidine kinase